jgi:hypothetical protein
MSLCQPNTSNYVSCGACCGLLNLKMDRVSRHKLLIQRTTEFQHSIDFSKGYTMAAYRKKREDIEETIPKIDPTIYSCPFLGFLQEQHKIGCMIHPIYSKDPLSQNYSFYGTSICQAYTCKNYESIYTEHWENLFIQTSTDSITYSLLASDHITISCIENYFSFIGISLSTMFQSYSKIVHALLLQRLELTELENTTSFEIDMEESQHIDPKKRLIDRLNIQPDSSLYRLLL